MTPDSRVDAYLAALPADQREQLQSLRRGIAEHAPQAVETISYNMPAFKVGSRFLLSYAAWKRHCSVYPITDDVLRKYEAALEGYGRTKGSLHFSSAQPLPDGLVEDLVRERVAALDAEDR
jgi:uncharacterized protein YdhG (YjbR/CyaY superfamily)